ncbi:hypothetical protein TTHERM_01084230 (macronuclear) [Tetrahymena thermophila SB210]|uniref:Uncharacterized protein n=1 Tax=Tetrahymena thermophila (strain SB210) TaxID=312017 RepID=Q22BU4_TETTS|nr:hypothetical protein TTHERM_01084230 [Tetrahymena thermophila SB210]EAR82756.4 hypothetical protein TTHERM_01084230 [Tetrahymena thermophila SB210]|eukprot:XP_001030419.4 hypothetical protein TTHERM_01084230 [Tetrahymena thermophila SB210]
MYLSPSPNRGSYLLNTEQKQTSEDYFNSSPHSQYSSSKQIDKKQRKAHSINEMIRKVEQEIINSEMSIHQNHLDQKSKSSNHSCNNSFSSVLQHQQQMQQQLNTHNLQSQPNFLQSASPCQQSKQINHNNYYYPTQTHHGYYIPPSKHNSQTHSIDIANKTSIDSYQDNVNNISRISTTKQSIFPQNTVPSASSSSHIFPQQYVTMKDFRKVLEEQLAIREQSIIQQISSCLKEQIIPEIKRQVVKELDKKKQQIDAQLQNIHQVVQENISVQQLDDKIYNLKMSFDKSKFLKAQTELKTQTLDQKYQNLEERINKIEENTFEHISIFEQYKLENQKTISDFKQFNRQVCRINEIVEKLSRSYISLEYSVRKNYDDICQKINELDSTEEVPFNIKKDKYSQGLMKELNKCLTKDSNQADTSSNQTEKISEIQEKQEPYCNNYKININQKNFNPQVQLNEQNQNNIFNCYDKNIQRVLLESFEEYDISPTLGKSASKKQMSSDKCRIQPKNQQNEDYIKQINNETTNENDYNYDYDYSSKIREVNISNRNISQILKLKSKLENKELIQEEIAEQIEESNDQEIPRAETQQSIDIHYVKKGLPQIFPLVQSTNFMQYEENSNFQYQENESQQIINAVQSIACSEMKCINQNEIVSLDDPIKLSELDLNQQNSILNQEKESSQNNFVLGNQVESLNIQQLNLQESNSLHNENLNTYNKSSSSHKKINENSYHSANKHSSGSFNQCPLQNNNFSIKKIDSSIQKECQDQQNISINQNRIILQSKNIEDLIQNKVDNNINFSLNDSQF